MKIRIISSSSKGNCYELVGLRGSLLIEAGVNIKTLLVAINHDIGRIKGLLVTHEHKDHSLSAGKLAALGIDVYASQGTHDALSIGHRAIVLKSGVVAEIGEFEVYPFRVEHDAAEPQGFIIRNSLTQEQLLFITDSYFCRYRFEGIYCVMVEANYSEDILCQNIEAGVIHGSMAHRVRHSHFEINRVVEFLKASDLSRTQKIVLMHLSSHNSHAEMFKNRVEEAIGIETVVAESGVEIEC